MPNPPSAPGKWRRFSADNTRESANLGHVGNSEMLHFFCLDAETPGRETRLKSRGCPDSSRQSGAAQGARRGRKHATRGPRRRGARGRARSRPRARRGGTHGCVVTDARRSAAPSTLSSLAFVPSGAKHRSPPTSLTLTQTPSARGWKPRRRIYADSCRANPRPRATRYP